MDEILKGINKKIIVIILRLSAFGLLLGYIYLISGTGAFSLALWISLPLLWLTPGHYSWLILPVLINMALWIPRRCSYLFLKIILRIEKYRLGVIFALSAFSAVTSPFVAGIILDGAVATARISGGALLYSLIVLYAIKHEELRGYFGWNEEWQDFKYGHQKYVYIFVFCLGIFALGLLERGITSSYYEDLVEQTTRSMYALDDLSKIDIAADKEMYLGTFSNGPFKGDVGIYSLRTGEEIKKLGIKEAWASYFIPNSQDILIRILETAGDGKSWYWIIMNMNTMKEKMRMEQTLHGEGFFAYKLLFSNDGRYFATVGEGMSVWDCREGEEIAYWDSQISTETLAWTGEQTFLMVALSSQKNKNDLDSSLRAVMQYKIADNQEAARTEKAKITASLRQKINELRKKKLNVRLEKGSEENTVLMIVSGESNSDYLSDRTYLEIWDTEKEELLFSLTLNGRITAAQIHPDKKRLVVFEGELEDNMIITYWDIKSQAKEKERIIAKLERRRAESANPSLGKTLMFAEQGGSFIWLENKLYVVTLEE